MRDFPLLLADKNPCPCAMYGTAKQYEAAAVEFAARAMECVGSERGQPHVSDQTCVQAWRWTAIDVCFQYGRHGWEKAKIVHFSHSSCGGRPRDQVIPEAEKLRVAQEVNPRLPIARTPFIPVYMYEGSEVKETPSTRTWIDRIRTSVEFLLTESKVSDNNRTRIMLELKQVGLTPGGIKYAPEKMKKGQKVKQKSGARVPALKDF